MHKTVERIKITTDGYGHYSMVVGLWVKEYVKHVLIFDFQVKRVSHLQKQIVTQAREQ